MLSSTEVSMVVAALYIVLIVRAGLAPPLIDDVAVTSALSRDYTPEMLITSKVK